MIRFERTSGMRTVLLGTILAACAGLITDTARAQQVVVGSPPSGPDINFSDTRQRIGAGHNVFLGHVEITRPDFQLFADQVEMFDDQNRAIATGNVVLSQGNSRIAADRAEFNTKTKLGTFYNAWGTAQLAQQKTRPTAVGAPSALLPGVLPGAVPGVTPNAVAPVTVADTDVYFFGDTIEKIGPRKFKIINGGFTTCVQPTPRWDLTSTSVILNLDHYTVLRDAVFRVKGVPMLYVPFLYYPTNKNERATGILLPTYGVTTLRGQSIHNAFFWAIDRSQDTTLMYDWFSTAGQGAGTEYRYNFGPGSNGNVRGYLLDQKGSSADTTSVLPASRSYELRGTLNQLLPDGFRAKVNVNYFSSFATMQTFNTNVYDASRNNRSIGGNIVGVVGDFSLNSTFNRTEYFYGSTADSAISGTWPRVTLSRSERPLLGSPLYFSLVGDYGRVLRDNKSTTGEADWSLNRFEFAPLIRYPFKKWEWFTVNSTLSWRDTYYSRSQSTNPDGSVLVVDQGLNRQYVEAQSQLSGPVFTRVWNTPDNGYAEKFKHTIEPTLSLSRTTAIDNYDQIIQNESGDSAIGGATRLAYGISNRFYARRRRGVTSQAREIAAVEITQSYYTDPRSSQHDTAYSTSFLGASQSNYSPIALSARGSPTDAFHATFRAEIDSHYLALRTISANGSYTADWLTTTAGWSKRAYIAGLAEFNDPTLLDQYVNASASARTKDTRLGVLYSMNYDVLRSQLLQQRITGFYNSQCCGVSFEYQVFNFNGLSTGLSIPADHRFFMSFTLAGLGNFSPFSGALSGAPH